MRSEVQILPDPPFAYAGAIAQLGERLLCKQEVDGSIPSSSTTSAATVETTSDSAPPVGDWCGSRFGGLFFNNLGKSNRRIDERKLVVCMYIAFVTQM